MDNFFISASIVLYKHDSAVRGAIESFLNSSFSVKLYLVDNSPTQAIKSSLADVLRDPRVEYIFTNKNIGFGAAHNVAMRKSISNSFYHLVLNPDVTFAGNVIPTVFAYMEANPDVGLLMPKVLYPTNATQFICKLLPSPPDLISRRFFPERFFRKKHSNYDLRSSGYNTLMEVPNLSGCFMFMRSSVLQKVGLFDERFFLYLEDTDLSRRFCKSAKNVFLPTVSIIHDHERGSYKNISLLFIHVKSAIKYFNKWGWWKDKERQEINRRILSSIDNGQVVQKTLKVQTARIS